MKPRIFNIIFAAVTAAMLASCGSTKTPTGKKPLYEVLTKQENGGGNIQFYEIISDEKEIGMLLGDEHLHGKVKPADIQTANFVILNLAKKIQAVTESASGKLRSFPIRLSSR